MRVSDSVVYMTADEEEGTTIAPGELPLDAEGTSQREHVVRRRGHDVLVVTPDKVDYMDVSPKEVVSIGTAMIPFLKMTMLTVPLMVRTCNVKRYHFVRSSTNLLVQVWNIQQLLTLVFAYWRVKQVKLYVVGVMKSTFFAIAMVVLIYTI